MQEIQEIQEINPRVDSLVNKINSLNAVFNQAENVCSEEIVEFIDSKTKEVELFSEDITPTEVIKLELMVDDFKFTRETLKETVENGRKILNILTLELLESDDDSTRSSLILSFAELVSSVNNSVKLLSSSYRDIANVLETTEKIRKSRLLSPAPIASKNNVYIDKLLVNEQISTTDIIARLRDVRDVEI
jgi:hypothetical protein